MKTSRYLSPFAIAAFAAACGGTSPDTLSSIEEVRSAKPHDAKPIVSADVESATVKGHNDFGFALYRDLTKHKSNENIVFSPTSIEYALAMTYAGARGNTATEMASVLGYS